jgi:hypothetical protein
MNSLLNLFEKRHSLFVETPTWWDVDCIIVYNERKGSFGDFELFFYFLGTLEGMLVRTIT